MRSHRFALSLSLPLAALALMSVSFLAIVRQPTNRVSIGRDRLTPPM